MGENRDRVACFKVGYFFAPQDRRRVGELQMHEYVLSYYQEIFREYLFDASEDAGRSLTFHVLETTKEELEQIALDLNEEIELSEKSFYTIVEGNGSVTGAPLDEDHPARDREKAEMQENDESGPTEKYRYLTSEGRHIDLREVEPLYNYQFTTDAEDDDLTIEIPGYFKGEALVRELYYNGGEHAIYVRNPHQILLCDHVNPGVRDLLSGAYDIFVSETDAKRDYMARVIHEDIDAQTEKALALHDYRFPYHPFPISDGTLFLGEKTCEICGETKPIYYVDRVEKDDLAHNWQIRNICPRCIVEKKENLFWDLNSEFRSIQGDTEVYWGGLPFLDRGKSTWFWAIHCNHLAIYLGQLEPEDLVPLQEELASTWDWLINPYGFLEPSEAFGHIDKGEYQGYLFKCAKCGKILCGISHTQTSSSM